ncbi:MAG: hypothetical protein LC777_11940, partial [Actinobacteria bacterium]|nr:hypothetical protein [Actinomycetota bacterium]
ALPQPPNPGREQVDALLAERKPDLVTLEGWRAIDGHELELGRTQLRPRVKLASRDELLPATAPGTREASSKMRPSVAPALDDRGSGTDHWLATAIQDPPLSRASPVRS